MVLILVSDGIFSLDRENKARQRHSFAGMDLILPAVQNFMGQLVQRFTINPNLDKISPDTFYSATAGLSA